MSESGHTDPLPSAAGRRGPKSASAFRAISEVARDLDVPQHVLRFWESKFSQVKPLKRGGGRRYYRPEDIELLRSIRALLYRDGYTIKGVQKLMREGNVAREADQVAAQDGKPQDGVFPDTTAASASPLAGQGVAQPAPVTASSAPSLDARQRREIEAVIAELTEIRNLLRD